MNSESYPHDQDPANLNGLAEVQRLTSLVCNGEISADELLGLESRLFNSRFKQQHYQRYMAMHAELFWLDFSNLDSTSPSLDPASLSSLATHKHSIPSSHRLFQSLLALAFMLLIGLGVGWFSAQWFDADAEPLAQADVTIDNSSRTPLTTAPALVGLTNLHDSKSDNLNDRIEVARITGSLNCRWRTPSPTSSANESSAPLGEPLGFGSTLYAGQELELVNGVAEVSFIEGARMILQAPVKVILASAVESTLHQGRLTTTCPPGAEGFRINTAGLELIDLGTEFGVLADAEGNTEVHVFQGLVEGRFRESVAGVHQIVQWKANETVRYDRAKNEIQPLKNSAGRYVRTLSPTLGPVNGLLAADDFDYPVGRWGGQNGGFGWGGAWEDISVEGADPRTNAIEPGSLSYGILSSSGNHAVLQGDFNRIRRILSTSISGVFDTAGFIEDQDGARLIGRDGTTLYLSFTQKIDRLDQVFYGFELNRGDGNRNRVLCIGHAAARGWKAGAVRAPDKEAGVTGWAVTSEFNGDHNSLLEVGDLGPESLDTTLLVLKITFGDENNDTIEVFKNPASLWNEDQCQAQATGTGNFSFDRISFANFEGDKIFEVDNLRIGTSFSSVTRPLWQTEPVAFPAGEPAVD